MTDSRTPHGRGRRLRCFRVLLPFGMAKGNDELDEREELAAQVLRAVYGAQWRVIPRDIKGAPAGTHDFDGREERTGDRFGLGREGLRLGQLGFELDGSQPAEGVLGSLPVVLPLDPDDDREAQVLPSRPSLLVEDVRLEQ